MIAPPNPENEIDRLAALYELRILDTPPDERFDRVTQMAARIFDAPIAYVSFVDSDRQWLKSHCGLAVNESSREKSFCGHAILSDQGLIVLDTLEDERFRENPMVTGEPNLRFYAGIPLRSADGFNVGTLCIADQQPRQFHNESVKILEGLGSLLEDQLTLLDVIEVQSQLRETKEQLERSNAFIRQVFGRYVADEVAEELLENPKALELGGELREVTVLMSDLRGFTPMSEQLEAPQVVEVLNRHFAHMVEVISKYGATIDNFIGDAILAVFGAPVTFDDAPLRAIACAIEMQQRMEEVNKENVAAGLPEVAMGVGIASGDAVAGNIGSEKRSKYSVIGSAVNLAARVESFTVGGQILIADDTRRACADDIRIDGSLRVKLKGIDYPVLIHEVGGVGSPYHVSLDSPGG